tara:strand:+ start:211 stop:447 length:237 start_codon:yes stop_codon:yes gene_type:complete
MTDLVNRPKHYLNNKDDIECIDYIKQQLGANFPSYLEANAIKYMHRHKYKSTDISLQIQDLEKCVWYINKLIDHHKNL